MGNIFDCQVDASAARSSATAGRVARPRPRAPVASSSSPGSDEARYNPLCRDAGVGGDAEDSDSDEDFSFEAERQRARVNRLRRASVEHARILEELEDLQRIKIARETEARLEREMRASWRALGLEDTLAWEETTERAEANRAAEKAAEAIGDAMEEEEAYDEILGAAGGGRGGFGGDRDDGETSSSIRFARHDDAWAAFESNCDDRRQLTIDDIPWPPACKDLLASWAAREMAADAEARRRDAAGGGGGGGGGDGGGGASSSSSSSSSSRLSGANARRMAAYKRAFKKATLRWHPDKFEAKYGARLSTAPASASASTAAFSSRRRDGASPPRADAVDAAVGETHAEAIMRRVGVISRGLIDSWGALSS